MAEPEAALRLDMETVSRLVRRQFPELQGLAISHQKTKGTDNHIFRIGDDLCARFPKVAWAAQTATREAEALPRFGEAPIAVPGVHGLGQADDDYPCPWSILTWLPGEPPGDGMLDSSELAARKLADFFAFVRSVPPDEAFRFGRQNNWRGAPLAARTEAFKDALTRLPDVDANWAAQLWQDALQAPLSVKHIWLHGDVHPGNLLVSDGQLCGVIDWGLCGVGDPACDLLTAWAVFDAPARDTFRTALRVDDGEWLRGAGWALSMAIIFLPYAYENNLPCDMSERMLRRLAAEFA